MFRKGDRDVLLGFFFFFRNVFLWKLEVDLNFLVGVMLL